MQRCSKLLSLRAASSRLSAPSSVSSRNPATSQLLQHSKQRTSGLHTSRYLTKDAQDVGAGPAILEQGLENQGQQAAPEGLSGKAASANDDIDVICYSLV
jgi:hypothetical protein